MMSAMKWSKLKKQSKERVCDSRPYTLLAISIGHPGPTGARLNR